MFPVIGNHSTLNKHWNGTLMGL